MASVPARITRRQGVANWLVAHSWGLKVTALVAFTVVSRLPFLPRYPFNGDTVNYMLALQHFDLANAQPHPPGNPLYVLLGKGVHLVVSDPNVALVWLSIGLAAVAVALTAWLGRLLWDEATGLWGSLLLAVNPLFWLYSAVGLPYTAEAVAGLLVGLATLACWRWPGWRSAVALGAAAAVAAGLRPTILVLLWPLLLLGLIGLSWRDRLRALGVGFALSLLWAVPLVWLSGGLLRYWSLLHSITESFAVRTTVLNGPSRAWLNNLGQLGAALLVGLGVPAVAFGYVWLRVRRRPALSRFVRWYLALWIVPPLSFFALVHFGQWGYLLLVLPVASLALYALTAPALGTTRRAQGATAGLMASVLTVVAFFLLRVGIREHDRYWDAMLAALQQFPADQTVVLTPDGKAPLRLLNWLAPQELVLGVVQNDDGQIEGFGSGAVGRQLYRLVIDPSLPAQARLVPYATAPRQRRLPQTFCPRVSLVVVHDPALQAWVRDAPAWKTLQLPGSEFLLWRSVPSQACLQIRDHRLQVVPETTADER